MPAPLTDAPAAIAPGVPNPAEDDASGPVAVAVSGGADSLLALVLLREQGRRVLALHGLFLPDRTEPPAGLARRCEELGASFLALDLRNGFEAAVAAAFAAAYAAGRTPNPCAACNAAVKFGLLLDRASGLGATALATGHYARLTQAAGRPELRQGADAAKDQSYFLGLTPGARLVRARLPLGGLTKAEVRAALARRGVETPVPAESQDVCFVPDGDYRAWLAARGDALPGPGPIVDAAGRVLGRHAGLWRHTVGQRRGLGLAHPEPLYVLAKDAARNALVVGGKNELSASGCLVEDCNFLVPFAEWPTTVLVQTRYRQSARPARARLTEAASVAGGLAGGDGLAFDFAEPRERPAPGQLAAAYDEAGRLLGAGLAAEDR